MAEDDPDPDEEDQARAALERMDEDAFAEMTRTLQEIAKIKPKQPPTKLTVVKKKFTPKPKK